MTLEGRIALVTGANRGIGREVARQLAGLGATVVLTAREGAAAERAAEEVSAGLAGRGRLVPMALDVADQASVDRLAAAVEEELGALHVLVNNAGINYDTWARAETADLDGAVTGAVTDTLATNLLGPWRMARAFLPPMRRGGWGRIVNVSSEAGSLASMGAGPPAYQVSKAALNALTRTLAGELRGTGILVNAVCPGWVATDMGGQGGRPVEDGAASVVWGATLPDNGPTGGFWRDGRALPW